MLTFVDLVHLASDLAVFWLAVAVYRWVAAVPRRFARLVASDRRAAVASALQRCEALAARVSLLSTEKEALREELEVARVQRAAALVEARLASRQVEWLTEADFRPSDEEEDTAPVRRDTVRSPPPADGFGVPAELPSEDAPLVVPKYTLPALAPLTAPRPVGAPVREPAREEDQTPPGGSP